MKKSAWIILALSICFAMGLHAEEPWKLVKDKDDIKVYTRTVPDSVANEFKGIVEINAPIEVIREVFRDIPSFTQWYGFCKEIKLLKHDTENHRVIYFVLKTMGPVKDRDFVMDVNDTMDTKAGKFIITMNALKEVLVPVQDKYVRMTDVTGMYDMTRMDNEKTEVVYTVKADPAGHIPAFISNLMQKDQPFLSLQGLREMVKKDIYYKKAGLTRNK
jgi:hypothetical protein